MSDTMVVHMHLYNSWYVFVLSSVKPIAHHVVPLGICSGHITTIKAFNHGIIIVSDKVRRMSTLAGLIIILWFL